MGQEYARAKEARSNVDYTYVDPMIVALDHNRGLEEASRAKERSEIAAAKGKFKYNLKELLVRYILHLDPIVEYQARLQNPFNANPQLDKILLMAFDNDTLRSLHQRGYDLRDFMAWTWILKAESAEQMATRLMVLSHPAFTKQNHFKKVPQFLFLFLLRRRNMTARALRSLLVYAWEWMERSKVAKDQQIHNGSTEQTFDQSNIVRYITDDPRGMLEDMFMLMIIRLLRSVRTVWPAACESTVALLCRYLDGVNFRKGSPFETSSIRDPLDTTRITFMYNTVLKLLALPSSLHPFQSALFQQRAQFSVLRRMNEFDPPLIVDRRGYRAVVSMQLMHKKTLREREWAHMKARSWPPWKEEKLGIDASIGVEHGVSRAKEALNRAREAGYACDDWDAAAGIFSGWDTDGSPTIQTRMAPLTPANRSNTVFNNTRTDTQPASLWVARIRATRTLEEAWSCFLSYKDQANVLRASVYHAFFEKLAYNSKENVSKGHGRRVDDHNLPGDGKEVLPAPESPKEAIYVPRPPPNHTEFLEMVIHDEIKVSGQFLNTVLAKAPSFQLGVKYLEASSLHPEHVSALLNDDLAKNPDARAAIESMPHTLLSAFVRFLTNFAPTLSDKHSNDQFSLIETGVSMAQDKDKIESPKFAPTTNNPHSENHFPGRSASSSLFNPLSRAVHLLLAIRPKYRPAWYHVLQRLGKRKTATEVFSRHVDQYYQDIKTWQLTCRLIDEMLEIDLPLDLDGFQLLCLSLEKSIFAAEKLRRAKPQHLPMLEGRTNDNFIQTLNRVLSEGLAIIKAIFKNTVRATEMQQDIPDLMAKEKFDIDEQEEQGEAPAMESAEGVEDEEPPKPKNFLPPACLLPKLLEVPGPAELHIFIRVLGLRRDYEGILGLIEWMSLFADEINTVANGYANGRRMMRKCLIATRVFLERSWMDIDHDELPEDQIAGFDGIAIEAKPAPVEIVRAVHNTVLENRKWGGWPTNEEVVEYCSKGRFL